MMALGERTEAAPVRARFAAAMTRVLDFALPPCCLACQAPVAKQGGLCAECWRAIHFIGAPLCRICGYPFPHDAGLDAVCGACTRKPPAFHRARAAMAYDEASRHLLLAFKHGDRTDSAAPFGEWLARVGDEQLTAVDIVVPVPLHQRRLWRQRYNQSALLAWALGRRSGVEVIPNLLRRRRATRSQQGLNPSERRRNLAGAFDVHPRHRARLEGTAVLLVDDVLTTGATLEACARELRRAGAARIEALTLARVVRPGG